MPVAEEIQSFPLFGVCNSERLARALGAPSMASAAWTTANLAVYTPIYIPRPTRFTCFKFFNGGVAGNNIDIGLYAVDSEGKPGAKLASTGATAQSGTNVLQSISVTPFWASGFCYLAASASGTTCTCINLGSLSGTTKDGLIRAGIFTQVTAHPLPASATPNAAAVATVVPLLMLAAA